MLDTPVQNLNITTLTSNALRRAGCRTVGDLLELGSNRVGEFKGIGTAGWIDIHGALTERGFRWTAEGKLQDQHLSPEARRLLVLVDATSPRKTVANILEAMGYVGFRSIINELRGHR